MTTKLFDKLGEVIYTVFYKGILAYKIRKREAMLKRLQLERIHTVLLDSVIAKADVQTIFDRLYEV